MEVFCKNILACISIHIYNYKQKKTRFFRKLDMLLWFQLVSLSFFTLLIPCQNRDTRIPGWSCVCSVCMYSRTASIISQESKLEEAKVQFIYLECDVGRRIGWREGGGVQSFLWCPPTKNEVKYQKNHSLSGPFILCNRFSNETICST